MTNIRRCVVRESTCSVRDMPERCRPASEMGRIGREHVSDVTLLANIIDGNRKINAVDLSAGLLNCYGSLTEIARTDPTELALADGMTERQARRLVAALEVGKRMMSEQNNPNVFHSPSDVFHHVRHQIHGETQEHFGIICLNSKRQGETVWITAGLLNASLVHPREVFANAIQRRASLIVCVHNHPTGDPSPSAADVLLTKQLIEAGKTIDIPVLDHIIVASPHTNSTSTGFVSMREDGLCEFDK